MVFMTFLVMVHSLSFTLELICVDFHSYLVIKQTVIKVLIYKPSNQNLSLSDLEMSLVGSVHLAGDSSAFSRRLTNFVNMVIKI